MQFSEKQMAHSARQYFVNLSRQFLVSGHGITDLKGEEAFSENQ